MKRFFQILLIIFLICGKTNAQYQVNYRSSTSSSITVRSVGYANNAKKALVAAELSAFKAVLFQGVDNAVNQTALVPVTEDEITKQHEAYFNNLFVERYKHFISASEVVQPFSKDMNKRKNMVVDVTIKLRALREDLERNGIVRKFGF